jgi:hypothetical protein
MLNRSKLLVHTTVIINLGNIWLNKRSQSQNILYISTHIKFRERANV